MRFDERNGGSVLERGFRLLEAFGPEGEELSLAELARRGQLPKPTALRLARQLVDLGALERNGDRYQLGLRLFELGSTVARQRRLREAALPFMEDLYEATHETIHLGVRDHLDVLYIEKISGRRRTAVPTQVGSRKPLHCTALGKAILSKADPQVVRAVLEAGLARHTRHTLTSPRLLLEDLATAAAAGVAFDREEYALGTTCVASPMLDRNLRAVGALSVTGTVSRFDPERVSTAVRTAALGLSRALGGRPWVATQAPTGAVGR